MYRDQSQAVHTARALLSIVGQEDLWDDQGPTDRARRLRDKRHGLSRTHRVAVLVAWSLWTAWQYDPGRGATLRDLLHDGSHRLLCVLGELLIAMSLKVAEERHQAIDEWIARRLGEQPAQGPRDKSHEPGDCHDE
ncbi:MAG TPA: hypothetical protein VLS89_17155 [Candidatus Nanopelagicales bacterium]|nr:hypothetical protein [Candidatus Nanopelagicales bacterium]